MFGVIITQICWPWPSIITELLLGRAVAQPTEAHIHGLRSFGLHVVRDDHVGGGVVGLHGRAWLRMPHFFQCFLRWDGRPGVDEHGADFCFSG